MAESVPPTSPPLASPVDWLRTVGAEQEKLLEQAIATMKESGKQTGGGVPGVNDAATIERVGQFWRDGLHLWQRFLEPVEVAPTADKRFKDPSWSQPGFAAMRQAYEQASAALMASVDRMDGVDDAQREKLRFAARTLADAMSPSNFPLTNPQVLARTAETGGQNLLTGMGNMLADLNKGQLTHTAGDAFELGRNLATTPGKVVKRTPMYELIQYSPTTDRVLATPLVIFPPWINRFYILDLTPEKSFIRWAVDQGLTVFMVSWKSADASMADVKWDDYVAAQIDAIDTVRDLLDVPATHAIGYCVAGTTLAATLAVLTAKGEADKVASATFFTAQVDFTDAGELKHFVDDQQMQMVAGLARDGYLDGRVMAATFNLLRGRDLIWNYVTNHYLLGDDYPAFDLLHWNGDTTNLPAGWHGSYLADLYRDNLLVEPGRLSVLDTPIDLTTVATPTYVQAGREDHIAPAESVWKITHLFRGPLRFVLAGSGHIAGVVNHPAAGKYQYWRNDAKVDTLAEFVAGATETKGSWWPDWIDWLRDRDGTEVAAEGARVPGEGVLPALCDAPGEYVRAR
ncbi:MAG: poly(R)-hydroxyalkanoic acid synthase [Sphingomonas bacterium]|uniref:PHA/PHB synthase family protein n=1 Tax=Sphingomonas bacterium TaxID=1895847 RepID=UPI002620ED17|nr:alpha/beta fold hydrolase [Sphingomonas bacterium]MDB5695403.1 poly(R)-hydroxyalkanoic acid synthase [Sphingomonas bacterium]